MIGTEFQLDRENAFQELEKEEDLFLSQDFLTKNTPERTANEHIWVAHGCLLHKIEKLGSAFCFD